MKKVSLKEIALKAGVSLRTVGRVLNEEPYVRAVTARKVSAVLTQYGYPGYYSRQGERILVISKSNEIPKLLSSFDNGFFQRVCRVRYDLPAAKLQKEIENTDIVILTTNVSEEYLLRMKDCNPDIFRVLCITAFKQNAELTIAVNNNEIGRIAANYLCNKKHCRTIYTFRDYGGNDEYADRLRTFCGTVIMNYPQVKLKIRGNFWSEQERWSIFSEQDFRDSGIFLPGCNPANTFLHDAKKFSMAPDKDFSFISCDNPAHFFPKEQIQDFYFPAFIEFHLEQAVEWLHYFLQNRPRMAMMPIVTYLPFSLIENKKKTLKQ